MTQDVKCAKKTYTSPGAGILFIRKHESQPPLGNQNLRAAQILLVL